MAQTEENTEMQINYVPSLVLLEEVFSRINQISEAYKDDFTFSISKNRGFELDKKDIQVCIYLTDDVNISYLSRDQHSETYSIGILIASSATNTDEVLEKTLIITEYIKQYMISLDFKASKFEITVSETNAKKSIESNWRTPYELISVIPVNGYIDDNISEKVFGMILKFTTKIQVAHQDAISHTTPLTFGSIILEKKG